MKIFVLYYTLDILFLFSLNRHPPFLSAFPFFLYKYIKAIPPDSETIQSVQYNGDLKRKETGEKCEKKKT